MVRFDGKKAQGWLKPMFIPIKREKERKIGKIQLAYLGVESTGTK